MRRRFWAVVKKHQVKGSKPKVLHPKAVPFLKFSDQGPLPFKAFDLGPE